jgi:hypothetical protein
MGVGIDEARQQRTAVRVNDLVGLGAMLAGDDRRDQSIPDLNLAKERLARRIRHN